MRTLDRAADTAALRARVAALQPDSRRRWGRMTAHQAVCHLADSFRMATGEKAVAPRSSLLERTVVKWFALYVPVPWPGGRIRTVPEVDQQGGGGTCPGDFARDLADLADRVVAFPSAASASMPHPVFGPMSRADWLRWAWLHTDHHLRQFGV